MIVNLKLSSGSEIMCECHDIDDGIAYVKNAIEVKTEPVMTDSGFKLLIVPRLYSSHVTHDTVIELDISHVMSIVIVDDLSESYYNYTYYGLLKEEIARRMMMLDSIAAYNYDRVDIHGVPAMLM